MKRIFLPMLVIGTALSQVTAAHDPGLSYLNLCLDGGELTVEWRLHQTAIDPQSLAVVVANQTKKPTSFEISQTDDQVTGEWRFSNVDSNYQLSLPVLQALGHGHRVLALDCGGQQRAVLSRFGSSWQPAKTSLAHSQSTPDSSQPNHHH